LPKAKSLAMNIYIFCEDIKGLSNSKEVLQINKRLAKMYRGFEKR
jgi:hypothetical protein